MPNTNTNNCTKRNPEEVTSTKIATGAKTIQEILNMASDMVPGASGQTFIKMVDSLKDLDANVAVYIAEMKNRGLDTRTAIEALTRIEAEENAAKAKQAEEEKAAKAWMSTGSGRIWRPVYTFCTAITKSAYTNPVRTMASAIMGAFLATDDKINTATVLTIKLTNAYNESNDSSTFINTFIDILGLAQDIYNTYKDSTDATSESGFYKLENVKYTMETWKDTIIKPE